MRNGLLKYRTSIRGGGLSAGLILVLILNVFFFSAIWGGKTLLQSATAPSVMPSGAYRLVVAPYRLGSTPDPGAPAWTLEPWIKIIARQYLEEGNAPWWNPYSAYGTPFAAAMQPQPFYALTILFALHPTAWTYNLFVIGRLFLAGVLTFYFARLFLSYFPALFAAISFMLNGYFIMFLDMPHVSVEVLLPAIFLAFELLLRRQSWGAMAASSIVVFLCLMGGMPESSFLAISLGCLFFGYRLITASDVPHRDFRLLLKFSFAVALGFALSSFLLFPFIEFMRQAHDAHQATNLGGESPGPIFDQGWYAALTYIFPGLWGNVLSKLFGTPWGGMRGGWGVLPSLFAGAATLDIFVPKKKGDTRRKRLSLFFAIALVCLLFKRFGSPLVNWIGYLPVANLVFFVKYDEPLIAFCVAMLAGVGFSLVLNAKARTRYFVAAVILITLLVALMIRWWWSAVGQHHVLFAFLWALCVGALIVSAAAVILCVTPRYPRPALVPWSLLGLLSLELFLSLIFPSFYYLNALPSAKNNDPYAGAPYISFLRERTSKLYRVFGRDGFLYPNWAGAFDLADVRDLDAMYTRRYMYFVRSFLLKPGDEKWRGELGDRFTGSGDGYSYDLRSDLEQRFLRLSSVRYVISAGPIAHRKAGPSGQNTYDWGGWADLRFAPKVDVSGESAFTEVYSDEVRIYEFSRPLPRAALFSAAEILPDEEVLRRLKDFEFNPEERIILSAESLPNADKAIVNSFATAVPVPYRGARITSYDSQAVRIETESPAPALLLLNDTNYSGWKAFVNGRPASILQANYLFRAVVVPTGNAVIEFHYEPISLQIGAVVSLGGLAAICIPIFVAWLKGSNRRSRFLKGVVGATR